MAFVSGFFFFAGTHLVVPQKQFGGETKDLLKGSDVNFRGNAVEKIAVLPMCHRSLFGENLHMPKVRYVYLKVRPQRLHV